MDADLEIALKLPSIIRMSINSQINEKLNVGATIDHYRWHECCGDEDGDIAVMPTDKQGNEVGSGDDEVQMSRQRTSTRQGACGTPRTTPLCRLPD